MLQQPHRVPELQTGQTHVTHASRIMKLVAQTSSSRMRQLAPSSRASWMLAAWLVLPLASGELKLLVSLPARRALCQHNREVALELNLPHL